MNALIVYDSRSGYTGALAHAIGRALEGPLEVRVARVDETEARDLAGIDLLVVGGPTEGHGATPAMRDWLRTLAPGMLHDVPAAAFDTRLHWPKLLSGSAADEIASRLREAGARLLLKPESFYVEGRETGGPMAEELDHAKGWANLVFDGLPMPVG